MDGRFIFIFSAFPLFQYTTSVMVEVYFLNIAFRFHFPDFHDIDNYKVMRRREMVGLYAEFSSMLPLAMVALRCLIRIVINDDAHCHYQFSASFIPRRLMTPRVFRCRIHVRLMISAHDDYVMRIVFPDKAIIYSHHFS